MHKFGGLHEQLVSFCTLKVLYRGLARLVVFATDRSDKYLRLVREASVQEP